MLETKLAKKFLRTQIQFVVKTLSETQIKLQSKEIEKRVFEAEWFKESQRISVFVSTQGEVITDNIIKKALELKKDVFIPSFQKTVPEMKMLKLQNLEEFQKLGPSVWGIKQHSKNLLAENYDLTGPLELVLTPGLAFTMDGKRLGKGKGYYDRFFASHERNFKCLPTLVGLAFKQQIVDDIPIDKHDYPMNYVIKC